MAERVVLLNGTSSAGKTTIARGLQRTEPGWLFLEFDLFVQMLTEVAPTAAPTATPEPAGEDLGRWLADAWYRALGGLAAAGFDLVVEDVIVERYRLDAAVRHLAPFDVTFVAVRCPLDVAVQRERARGDRAIGLVTSQFDHVHAGRSYDCEIDTSTTSPEACVAAIEAALERDEVRAFEAMRTTGA